MKKRNLLIIVFVAVVFIVAVVAFFLAKKEKTSPPLSGPNNSEEVIENLEQMTDDQKELAKSTIQLVNTWGNSTDKYSPAYMKAVKTFMSDSLYTEYEEFAQISKEMASKYATPIPKESYTIKSIESIEQESDDVLSYKITGVRELPEYQWKQDSVTVITYQKIDDQWKAIAIESD